jgi:hypothetical protein
MKKLFLALLTMCMLTSAMANEKPKNWMSFYIWDAFTPLVLDKTIPEMLISLEVIFQQHANYSAKRELKINRGPWGTRSTEGHFMVWIHLSDEFLEKHNIDRANYPEKSWMFKDRESDMFIAWGGDANFRDFILDGLTGLTNVTIYPDGTKTGSLQGFEDAIKQGNADYEGGFYMTDEQTLKALEAIHTYGGHTAGYSFLSKIEDKPNDGYEHDAAQGVNGHNCGDFAFWLFNESGVIPKHVSESLKMKMWYPKKYWDGTIPLRGSGGKVYKKFAANRDLYMDRNQLLKVAWFELIFTGLDFFNERYLVFEMLRDEPELNYVRLWDQANVIKWLSDGGADFKAKSLLEELKPLVDSGAVITGPEATVADKFRYRMSRNNYKYQRGAARRTKRKMRKAFGWFQRRYHSYKEIEDRLKAQVLNTEE